MNVVVLELALMALHSHLNICSEWSKERLLARDHMKNYRYGPYECLSYKEAIEAYFELDEAIKDIKRKKTPVSALSISKKASDFNPNPREKGRNETKRKNRSD